MTRRLVRFLRSVSDDGLPERVFDNLPLVVLALTDTGEVARVSEEMAKRLGYQPKELVGRRFADLVWERSRRPVFGELKLAAGPSPTMTRLETNLVAKDQSCQPVLILGTRVSDTLDLAGAILAVCIEMEDQEAGSEIHPSPSRNEATNAKISALAHDFNDLLTVIRGNLEVLQREVQPPTNEQFMKDSADAAARATVLTRRLQTLAGHVEVQPNPVDMISAIRIRTYKLARFVSNRIVVKVSEQRDVWRVAVDGTEHDAALTECVQAACHAMPHGGTLVFEIANIAQRDVHKTNQDADLSPGDYFRVCIRSFETASMSGASSLVFEIDRAAADTERGRQRVLWRLKICDLARSSGGAARIAFMADQSIQLEIMFPAARQGAPGMAVSSSRNAPAPKFGTNVMVVEACSDLVAAADGL